ncbi:MAG: hypothetical protein GY909_06480 [Oligoflexia bacterium]|nr:hypothetical protein [Oligoflexia bacterium]
MKCNRRDLIKLAILSSCFSTKSIFSYTPNTSYHTNLKYVHLNIAGGPCRWLFDNPIAPFKESKIDKHPMIVNTFANKGNEANFSNMIYGRTKVQDFYMPKFWEMDLYTSTGKRKASELLENCLIVRGVHMGIDGHSLNNRRLLSPVPGKPNLTGLLAGNSNKVFPSVNLVADSGVAGVAGGTFYSENNATQVDVPQNHDNPFHYLLNPFVSIKEQQSLFANIENEYSDLKDVLKLDFDLLKKRYLKLKKIYEKNIHESIRTLDIEGLSDRSIKGLSTEKISLGNVKKEISYFANNDVHIGNKDFRTTLKTSVIENLGNEFAIAQILIENDLISTLTLNINTLTHLYYEDSFESDSFERVIKGVKDTFFKVSNLKKYTKSIDRTHEFQLDSHDTGLLTNMFLSTYFYRGISSCLLEMKRQLQSSKKWNEVIFHLASEFDRDPRPDGSGSEHGWNGHVSSFFGGAIEGLQVVGNVEINSKENSYYKDNGTWGQGAKISDLDNRFLVYGNIISGLSSFFGVNTPTPNDNPLFTRKAGKLKLNTRECRNV